MEMEYLEEMMDIVLYTLGYNSFQDAMKDILGNINEVLLIAKLAKPIIDLAENGNEVSLNIVQEATHAAANYIITLNEKIEYIENNIILSGNGSVIKNQFFRNLVNDELKFHFKEIKWTFSTIASAYGSGIMAARLKNINVSIPQIIKGKGFVAA